MRNFHIKSILLGIGMGIVITSLISMIYAAGINTNKSMSREEIITKAKELGMVEGTSLLGTQQNESDKKDDNSNVKAEAAGNSSEAKTDEAVSNKPVDEKTAEKAEKSNENDMITITVKSGESSEDVAFKLMKSGLISSDKEFVKKLTEMGLSTEINVGEFKIKKGISVVDIIKSMTERK